MSCTKHSVKYNRIILKQYKLIHNTHLHAGAHRRANLFTEQALGNAQFFSPVCQKLIVPEVFGQAHVAKHRLLHFAVQIVKLSVHVYTCKLVFHTPTLGLHPEDTRLVPLQTSHQRSGLKWRRKCAWPPCPHHHKIRWIKNPHHPPQRPCVLQAQYSCRRVYANNPRVGIYKTSFHHTIMTEYMPDMHTEQELDNIAQTSNDEYIPMGMPGGRHGGGSLKKRSSSVIKKTFKANNGKHNSDAGKKHLTLEHKNTTSASTLLKKQHGRTLPQPDKNLLKAVATGPRNVKDFLQQESKKGHDEEIGQACLGPISSVRVDREKAEALLWDTLVILHGCMPDVATTWIDVTKPGAQATEMTFGQVWSSLSDPKNTMHYRRSSSRDTSDEQEDDSESLLGSLAASHVNMKDTKSKVATIKNKIDSALAFLMKLCKNMGIVDQIYTIDAGIIFSPNQHYTLENMPTRRMPFYNILYTMLVYGMTISKTSENALALFCDKFPAALRFYSSHGVSGNFNRSELKLGDTYSAILTINRATQKSYLKALQRWCSFYQCVHKLTHAAIKNSEYDAFVHEKPADHMLHKHKQLMAMSYLRQFKTPFDDATRDIILRRPQMDDRSSSVASRSSTARSNFTPLIPSVPRADSTGTQRGTPSGPRTSIPDSSRGVLKPIPRTPALDDYTRAPSALSQRARSLPGPPNRSTLLRHEADAARPRDQNFLPKADMTADINTIHEANPYAPDFESSGDIHDE